MIDQLEAGALDGSVPSIVVNDNRRPAAPAVVFGSGCIRDDDSLRGRFACRCCVVCLRCLVWRAVLRLGRTCLPLPLPLTRCRWCRWGERNRDRGLVLVNCQIDQNWRWQRSLLLRRSRQQRCSLNEGDRR
jgi:hypothetical protein